jgi:hypothetical protein
MFHQRRHQGRLQDPGHRSLFSLPALGVILFAIYSIANPVQVKTEDKAETSEVKVLNEAETSEVKLLIELFSKAKLQFTQSLVNGHDGNLGSTFEGVERPGASRKSEEKPKVRGDQGPPSTEFVMPLFQEEMYSEEDPEGDEAEDGSGEGRKTIGTLAVLIHKNPGDPEDPHDAGSGSGDHNNTKKVDIPQEGSSSMVVLAVAGCISILVVALIAAGVYYYRRRRGAEWLPSTTSSSSTHLSTQLSSISSIASIASVTSSNASPNASLSSADDEEEEQEEVLDQSTEEPDGVEGGDVHAGEQEEQGGDAHAGEQEEQVGEERDGDISEHSSSGISGSPPNYDSIDSDTEVNSGEDASQEIR